jgi:uncharacterized damage-inducible protein DinB
VRTMTKFVMAVLAVLVVTAAFSAPVRAADAAKEKAKATVKSDMMMWINDAEDKIGQLAEATPEEKYAWRPAEGVRSTGEVFMHVAAANFGIGSFWGIAPPAGFAFDTYEKSLTKKADIQKALKESFAHMKKGLEAATDADFEKNVDLFGGMKMTERSAYMLLLSHAHEHLGQSIAYARMNGITPPWTAQQQAQIEAAQAKAKEMQAKDDGKAEEKKSADAK